jgi:hypothetical protein
LVTIRKNHDETTLSIDSRIAALDHLSKSLETVMTDKPRNKAGYKRPPKHSQFQSGQSGNPSGRPKHVRNFRTDLQEELSSLTVVMEHGCDIEVSKQRAIIKTFIAAAIDGDMRAATAVLTLCARIADPVDDDHEHTPEEIEILDAFLRRERGRQEPPAATDSSTDSSS